MSEKSNSGTPPIITMDKKTKLKLCLFGNICLLFIVISLMFTFQSESKYCRIGPHDDLLILAYKVDTWNKYYIILGIICFIKITKVFIQELGMPILGFSIYNPDKTVIHDFTKNELQFYANSMYLISSLRYVFEIMVTISQLDLAVFSVIVSEGASFFTIRLLLNEKRFVRKEDMKEYELNEVKII